MDPSEDAAKSDGEPTRCAEKYRNNDSKLKSANDQHNSNSDASKAEEGPTANGTHLDSCKSSKHQRGWRRIVRNFTPSWFAVNMGTGIVSILLHNLPYNGQWLQYISYIIFALNVVLFVLFFLLSLLRYTLYPEIWVAMIKHPAQSLFIGCFPMGLATIINMICFVCVPACMAYHDAKLETITAVWLLPVVSTIVAAASGSIVASILPYPQWQLITLITSYILWGKGVSLAMVVLVCYFLRLTTSALPPKEIIVSVFLPLGPLGQGGFAIQNLGNVARLLFRETDTLPLSMVYAGDILYVVGFLIAMVMWGFGLVWFFFAIATIWRTPRFPFNMGWWGFTFPLGVYAVCTTQLATELPSAFFRVLGTIFSVAVTLLWMVVSCGTLWKAWTGEIFIAPCLRDLPEAHSKPRAMRRNRNKAN